MSQLLMGLVLIVTISTAVAFGVASGYLIITGILNALAHKPETTKPAPELATQGMLGD